jgi:hypothetical protein
MSASHGKRTFESTEVARPERLFARWAGSPLEGAARSLRELRVGYVRCADFHSTRRALCEDGAPGGRNFKLFPGRACLCIPGAMGWNPRIPSHAGPRSILPNHPLFPRLNANHASRVSASGCSHSGDAEAITALAPLGFWRRGPALGVSL